MMSRRSLLHSILLLSLSCGIVHVGNRVSQAAEPPITALAFDPTETLLLAGSQTGVMCYSWPELRPQKSIGTKLGQIHDIAFSPDDKTLALAGGTSGEEGSLELWNWPERKDCRSYEVHSDLIYEVVWAADSRELFTASHNGEVRQIAAKSGKVERTFVGHSQPVVSLALLADQQTLVSAGSDQTIRVWNTRTGEAVRSLNNHTQPIRSLAVRPEADAKALPMTASIAADRTLRLWQPTIGRMVRFLRLESQPLALAWSPDGEVLYVAGSDGTLKQIIPATLEIATTYDTKVEHPVSLLITKAGTHAVIGGTVGTLQVLPLK